METLCELCSETILFSVIRRGMGLSKTDVVLSENDCNFLYHCGINQSILPIIWEGIRDLDVSSDWRDKFNRTSMIDARNYVMRDYALNQIARTLDKTQIPYIFLKGSVLCALYPEEWMRTSFDIDVLVPEQKTDAASELIEKETDFKFQKRNYHDISMVSPYLHLELHFNIKEHMDNIDKLLEHVWDYAVTSGDGNKFILTPEFQVFHVIAHMSYHMVHGGPGIRPFLDLWLLRNKTSYDEETVRQMCSNCGILTFYERSCSLVDAWMTGKPVPEELAMLEKYALNGGVFGNKENALASRQRAHRGLSYYFNRVFMSRELLETEYPELKDKPYQLLVCQTKRWLRLLNPKKRRQVREEISTVRAMKSETIDSFDKLLVSLGL